MTLFEIWGFSVTEAHAMLAVRVFGVAGLVFGAGLFLRYVATRPSEADRIIAARKKLRGPDKIQAPDPIPPPPTTKRRPGWRPNGSEARRPTTPRPSERPQAKPPAGYCPNPGGSGALDSDTSWLRASHDPLFSTRSDHAYCYGRPCPLEDGHPLVPSDCDGCKITRGRQSPYWRSYHDDLHRQQAAEIPAGKRGMIFVEGGHLNKASIDRLKEMFKDIDKPGAHNKLAVIEAPRGGTIRYQPLPEPPKVDPGNRISPQPKPSTTGRWFAIIVGIAGIIAAVGTVLEACGVL